MGRHAVAVLFIALGCTAARAGGFVGRAGRIVIGLIVPLYSVPRQMAGWLLFSARRGEESPGSTETRCRITSGGGDPRDSATEMTPPTGLKPRQG